MYNRYIPQQDGSFQKNRIATPPPQPPQPHPEPVSAPASPPQRRTDGAFTFLRQLLPKNLDTGDLMIILLLLLMAGDCEDNKNNWLLTLALYLFL
ncbi:MAG: hypothetical protein E7447_04005 [Ruminococcaceae bacterium]|nr:hypothetical protein [Oscillospiraceae bacterium]